VSLLSLLILSVQYFSKVFKCLSFFPAYIIPIVSITILNVCLVFSMWLGYPEFLLLFLVA
jgi:hypothetical protein